ncbi:MAG: GNAT family N-acetyltransferase [Armatimonadetes bacterium]|nr:GNAT family N-acetyltransferase [Armatimonadota bacterium]
MQMLVGPEISVVPAGVEHYEAILEAVKTIPFTVSPLRPWSLEDVRSWLVALVQTRWKFIVEQPQFETLIAWDGRKVHGWIVLQHGTEEGATGDPQTTIVPPSHVSTPALLEEATRRARAHGSRVLTGNILTNDELQNATYRENGMVAEFQRIVLSLKEYGRDSLKQRAFERASRSVAVRRAEYSDQLTLLRLATECVNLMFHASRSDQDVERIQTRFIESYATLNVEDEKSHVWIAETAEGDPCAALQIDPRRDHLLDGTWQAYISDISVSPEYWGRAAGVALVARAIPVLQEMGITYLAGDISTTNERVWSLSQKFGFHVESYHYVKILEDQP